MIRFRAVVETARQTLVALVRSRSTVLLLVAAAGAAGVAALIAREVPGHVTPARVAMNLGWWLVLQLAAPWITLYCAVQALHGDIEDRTFVYLHLQPVPRWTLLAGKLVAVWVAGAAAVCLLWLAVWTGLGSAAGTGTLSPRPLVACALAAVLAYGAIGAFFAVRFRRPLVWSVAYVLGLETLAANLPAKAGVRTLTVMDPVRRWFLQLHEVAPHSRVARDLWPAQRGWDDELLGWPPGTVLVFLAIALVLSVWVFARSEYDSRPRDQA